MYAPKKVLQNTTVVDPKNIDSKYLNYTMAGMSNKGVMNRLDYASQFEFDGPTSNERNMQRMIYEIEKRLRGLSAILPPGKADELADWFQTNISICDAAERTLNCHVCEGKLSADSDSQYNGLEYRKVTRHCFGREFDKKCMQASGTTQEWTAGDKVGGCYARGNICDCNKTIDDFDGCNMKFQTHLSRCDFTSKLAELRHWRSLPESEGVTSLSTTTQLGNTLGRWILVQTGKSKTRGTNRKYAPVTGRARELLEPLVRGLKQNGWEQKQVKK